MTKRTLAELQNAFKTPERTSTPGGYYPFTQMPYDSQAKVRFLPDKNADNPMGFLVEIVQHNLTINGNNRSVPCLTMYGEDCPICAVSQQYYKSGDESNGKLYWRKKQHIGQVLVMEDPLPPNQETGETYEGTVRRVRVGFQLFGIIKSAFESGDLDEIPYAYKGGYDFIIKKVQQGEYPNYTMGSNFARKASDLDDETIAMVEEELIDLATARPAHPGLEKVEAMLNAALTGEEYVEPGSSDATSAFAAQVKKTAKKTEKDDTPFIPDALPEVQEPAKEGKVTREVAKAAVKAVAEEREEEPAELDPDAEDILAKIRSRRKKKAAE